MTYPSFALVSAVLTALLGVAPSLAQVVQSEFIYDTAPYPSCHASTIEQTDEGLVAAWFGGTREKHPDVGIRLARHIDGAWTTPVEVANGVQSKELRYPCWNPVLFQPRLAAGGKPAESRLPLILFYKVGPDPESWWGMLMTSADGGNTWSEPIRLPGKIVGPIKNKPIQLANGDILSGTSSEDQGWRVHVERSRDLGKTWEASEPLNDGKTIGAIQPSFLKHGKTTIQAIGRTRDSDKLYEVWSQDGGRSWDEMKLTELPNPNSGTDALTLKDGRHLLVYNHSTKHRWPLNVAISTDGKTWKQALVLESDSGEFSYPAVIQTRDNLVHVTYTWNRKKIRHVVIDPAQL